MAFSNYTRNLIRNHLFRDATFSKSTARWIALCESAPTAASTGSTLDEPADANYARVQLNADDDNWSGTADGATDNLSALTWSTADTGYTVSHFAVCDAETAGNVLFYGSLTGGPIEVGACEVPDIAIGALDMSIT